MKVVTLKLYIMTFTNEAKSFADKLIPTNLFENDSSLLYSFVTIVFDVVTGTGHNKNIYHVMQI